VKYLYLCVLLSVFVWPLYFCAHPTMRLYRYWRSLLKAILIPSVVFWIWDIVATARGHWSFNPDYVLGVQLVNLPVEEYFFFIVVAFVSIFTYEVVKSARAKRP